MFSDWIFEEIIDMEKNIFINFLDKKKIILWIDFNLSNTWVIESWFVAQRVRIHYEKILSI